MAEVERAKRRKGRNRGMSVGKDLESGARTITSVWRCGRLAGFCASTGSMRDDVESMNTTISVELYRIHIPSRWTAVHDIHDVHGNARRNASNDLPKIIALSQNSPLFENQLHR